MMKYNIVPNAKLFETIEANSLEEAMEKFATNMDLDMNAYFKAVPQSLALYSLYNETEDFRILVRATSQEEALELAQDYSEDSSLMGTWKVQNDVVGSYDCDYVIQSSENENGDVLYVDEVLEDLEPEM